MKPLLLEEVKHAIRAEARTVLRRQMITGVSTDSRRVRPGEMFVALRGERFDGHAFVEAALGAGASAVLVERNVPLTAEERQRGVAVLKVDNALEALGRLARFYRRELQHSIRVVAVTGSNGKTTTREMIYHAMSRYRKGHRSPHNYNNAVGVPLTLLGLEPEHEFAVVEMGTSGPGEIAALARIAEPDIAVITQVGPSHLEGLRDLDGVSGEKMGIVAGLREHGVLIVGLDHQGVFDRARALGCHLITFGMSERADVSALRVWREGSRLGFETNDRCTVELPAAGLHNVSNALAALAACRRLGLTTRQFADALRDFQPVPGRLSARQVNGITILDDSYNANPSSMAAALAEIASRTAAGRRIFVCGDMCELGAASEQYHRDLGRAIAAAPVDLLLTVGSQAARTAEAALEAGMGRARVQRCTTAKRLARLIKALLHDEDVILVKGSRAMALEEVVRALERYPGGRPVVARGRAIGVVGAPRAVRVNVPTG